MLRRNWFILTVIGGVVAFLETPADLRAVDEKHDGTLILETAYFEKPLLKNAKTVGLETKLDGKGGGTGKLTLDPNLKSGKASTAMRIGFVKVTLNEVKTDESAKKGRQLYEISGEGLDRLLLSVPAKGDGPCWLLICGKEGIEDIVEMQRK